MTLTFPPLSIFNFSWIIARRANEQASSTKADNSIDETGEAERAYLRELMFSNPEAVHSDLGAVEMLSRCRRH